MPHARIAIIGAGLSGLYAGTRRFITPSLPFPRLHPARGTDV